MRTLQQNKETEALLLDNQCHLNSEQYKFINSGEIKQLLENDFNYSYDSMSVAKVKNELNNGFQKHIMRFNTGVKIGQDDLQLLVTNSYNGSASLKIDLGLFRAICANGLVVGNSIESERVKHIGHEFYERVACAINKVTGYSDQVVDLINRMKSINVTDGIKHDLMLYVLKRIINSDAMVYTDNKNGLIGTDLINGNLYQLNEDFLFRPTRAGDMGTDLYTVYNVIQEKLIKGNVYYLFNKAGSNKIDNKKLRLINSIDTNIKVNKDLFDIAERHVA